MMREVTPRGAIKIYGKIIKGADGERLRQGEKVVGLCRKVWNVMRPLYPDVFPRPTSEGVVNPWMSVVLKRRVKKKKHAVTREEVYKGAPCQVTRPRRPTRATRRRRCNARSLLPASVMRTCSRSGDSNRRRKRKPRAENKSAQSFEIRERRRFEIGTKSAVRTERSSLLDQRLRLG